MGVTSANTHDLAAFVKGSHNRVGRLSTTLNAASSKANVVMPACSGSQYPSTPSLSALNELLSAWTENQEFVRVVHDELVEADQYDADGNAVVSNTVIDTSLKAKGLDDAPDLVDVDAIELYGQPPYSGFVDDPISLANGNFLLREGDLALFGAAAPLSVVRAYNSRDRRAGAFGTGWTSLVDVGLVVEGRRASFRGPDGGGSVFQQDDDGTWVGGRRRQQVLVASPDGYVLSEGHERSWTFDGDGVLTAFTADAADVTVQRAPATVRFTDRASSRWVSYRIDVASGLVSAVDASDGRSTAYVYDADGRIRHVRRDPGDVAYEHDEDGFLATVTDADGVVVCRNTYDAAGRVLAQVEHHGRETRYEYRPDGVATVTASDGAPPNVMVHDRRGRLTAMIDGLGNTMRMAYDDADRVVQIVDRTGATTRYERDGRGNVVRRTDPDGLTVRSVWDEQDRLTAETDRAGGTTRFEYEGDLREPARIIQADGSEIVVARDEAGRPTSVTDDDGVTATLEWNRDGLLVAVSNGAGGRTAFRYDDAGRTIAAALPGGRSTDVVLDAVGRVQALTAPEGAASFEYSAAGRMVGGRDVAGATWTASHDRAGELAALADSQGALLRFERDLVGQVTATIDGAGGRFAYEHDPVGRATSVIDPEGNRTETAYDPEGRAVQVTDPTGRRVSRELDQLGRTTMAVSTGGSTSVRSYHPNGELASVTDGAGHEWTYAVDPMGRVVASTDPLGGTTTYRYTPGGRLAEIRSPLGRTIRREYDAAGRLARVIEPDGTEAVYERNPDGTVRRVVRAGVATSVDYDEAGRTTAIAGPWGELAAVEERGAVAVSAGPDVEPARFEHDERGQLRRVTDPAGVVTEFAYDGRGQRIAHTTGAATSQYEWTDAGRLSSVTDPYGHRTALEHDARGIVDRVLRPDGTSASCRFGADGLLAAALDGDGREILAARYDANGAVTALRSEGADLAVTRDALGRPTTWTTAAGSVHATFDADGDRLSTSDDTGYRITARRDDVGRLLGYDLGERLIELPPPVDVERDATRRITVDEAGRRFRYDRAGRLAEADLDGTGTSTTRYGYDDRGLLATERSGGTTTAYRYGQAGELVSCIRPDGVEVTYEHDAAGRRTAAAGSDGSRTTYRWDGAGRLTAVERVAPDGLRSERRIEQDPAGRPMRVDGVPILWDDAGSGELLGIGDERYLRHGNQILVATDPSASWSRRTGGDPWGNDGGTGVRLGYRGELAVDGLLFLGARVYDTETRTFLSRDPLPSVPGCVAFAGVYSYAWNDPVNLVDPSGRRPLTDDEYEKIREAESKGFLKKHWKTIAKVAVVVVSVVAIAAATVLLPGIGGAIVAGAIIGGLSNGAMTAIDGGSLKDIGRSALIGAAVGGLTAGIGNKIPVSQASNLGLRTLSNTGRSAASEFPGGFGNELLDEMIPGGDPEGFNYKGALRDSLTGTAGGVLGEEVTRHIPDINLNGALDGETPGSLLPDPARNTVLDINTASVHDLQQVQGIGPATARRIVEQRNATGGFGSTNDLLDINGIGEGRLNLINNAGGIAL